MDLEPYLPLCNAFVTLLEPLVEIVIHDLATGTICFIAGSLSKREVGDLSLLDEDQSLTETFRAGATVYSKLNFDGRLIRSTALLLEEEGKPQALMCLNFDISVFQQIQNLARPFLSNAFQEKAQQPEALFKNDWQERLHIAVHQYLEEKGWAFDQISSSQKKELVRQLFRLGAFEEKNAADYIAKILSMGRATVFKWLKEWREKE